VLSGKVLVLVFYALAIPPFLGRVLTDRHCWKANDCQSTFRFSRL